jgi:hypothetical protein
MENPPSCFFYYIKKHPKKGKFQTDDKSVFTIHYLKSFARKLKND